MRTKANGHIWMAAEQFFNAAELIFNNNDINLNKVIFQKEMGEGCPKGGVRALGHEIDDGENYDWRV